jgi:mycothiol S-conjugate amidase
MARYHLQGVRTVLVTCTGGEAGDILNAEADTAEARADLGAVRRRELEASVRIIGYDALHLLGYRDSGMPDSEHNGHPDNFANADLDEAVGRLTRIIRAERPQVVVTYGDDQRGYRHPDHLRVHEVSVAAYERAGDPDWYPAAGSPWQPLKLYYSGGFTRRRVQIMHEWLVEHGQESPYTQWMERWSADEPDTTTTRVDVSEHMGVARDALRAHRTQVDGNGAWFRIPVDVARRLHPWEEFVLARSLVGSTVPDGGFETDLFAGLRVPTGT